MRKSLLALLLLGTVASAQVVGPAVRIPFTGGGGSSAALTAADISAATTCVDVGANDTYACTLAPAITAYATGLQACFVANTANTGASSINFNGLGALTIKRKSPLITSDTVDSDIRAGQVVCGSYDGTNFQMNSLRGNAFASGETTNCTTGSLVHINTGASTIACNNTVGIGTNNAGQIRNITVNVTAGTMSYSMNSEYRSAWHSASWTNANVTALGAVTTGNISAFTLPAKFVIENMYVVITGAAAGPATVTVSCGRTGAAYIDYIVASDAKAAANTVYGDAAAERGTNLVGYDLPSYTATTVVNCQFISTGANLNTVTGSTGTVIFKTAMVP